MSWPALPCESESLPCASLRARRLKTASCRPMHLLHCQRWSTVCRADRRHSRVLIWLPYFHSFAPGVCAGRILTDLAGAEGFEPPSSVLETDSLAVELTPLKTGVRVQVPGVKLCAPTGVALTDP